MHSARYANPSSCRNLLQTSSNIDAVAKDVVAIDDDVADVDADTEGDATIFWNIGGLDRNLDLAITRMDGTVTERDIELETLFDDRLAVVAGQTNPLTRRRKLTLNELIDGPWALPPPDNFLSRFIAESFLVRGLELPRATVITPSIHIRNSLLAAGRFITILPSAVLCFPGYRGWLKALPLQLQETSRPIGLIRLKKRDLSPVADLFVRAVRFTTASK